MAERSSFAECSECGKLVNRDEIENIPDGFGAKVISGPKSPVGWSGTFHRRRVRFMVTKKVCFRCLGYKETNPQFTENKNIAAACGFKRFFPPSR